MIARHHSKGTGRWGLLPAGTVCGTLRVKQFSGFEFFLLPSRVHPRPTRKSLYNGPLEEHQGYKIEPAADGMIDKLVYELSHKGMIWIERLRDKDSRIVRGAFWLPLNQQGEAS